MEAQLLKEPMETVDLIEMTYEDNKGNAQGKNALQDL